MHEAYHVHSLAKLNVQVEAIAAYDDVLLVGTRQGHLIMYRIVKSDDKCDVELLRLDKSFSKKPVQQLEVIGEYHLLVSLTDNLVQLHDINAMNFTTLHQIQKSKGATLFTTNIVKQTSLTGDVTVLVRLAVVVKRKLQIYYLKNNQFLPLMDDINLSEVPRTIQWCQTSICVGYRTEYSLFKLDGSDIKTIELFPTSSTAKSSEPCITKVSDSIFGLCRENQTVLVNTEGQTEKTKALRWSEPPSTLAWDEPYAVGVLSESVEIQTLEEANGMVQNLSELSKIRCIVACKQGLLYAASVSQVWCICAVDIARQRKVLLDSKQFQLALKLTSVSDENDDYKKEEIHQIQTLLAYDLFANKQFHESMKEFLKLGTDPYDVIRLFPDLLPQQSATSAVSSEHQQESVKDLTEKELENGLLALIDFLTEMRHRLQSEPQQNSSGNLNDKVILSKSTQQLLQIIDTTLLKCYLQTNDALVAPLLRLNHCHLGETEKILKKMGKHNELIILYQTKGQHRKALELLQAEAGIERIITYLQHLGSDNMGLIIEFSDWVLRTSPEDGIKIFTEDLPEVEALPRPRVLDFLLRSHSNVVIDYLEHVVHTWKDTNPLFHNALVHQYREKIMAVDDDEHTHKKLLEFLKSSQNYTADTVLGHFPLDRLLEERAVILGKLGKHNDALVIYVRGLGDVRKAEDYCRQAYDSNGRTEVYAILIKLILDPPLTHVILPNVTLSPKTAQPDLELALELLQSHAYRIDPLEILDVLPDHISVSRIHKFLLVALQKAVKERRRVQLLKGLLYAEHLQCQELRLHLQGQHVLITELNVCPVCKKRFGNQSALVRYPNGDVVHYSCQEKRQ